MEVCSSNNFFQTPDFLIDHSLTHSIIYTCRARACLLFLRKVYFIIFSLEVKMVEALGGQIFQDFLTLSVLSP